MKNIRELRHIFVATYFWLSLVYNVTPANGETWTCRVGASEVQPNSATFPEWSQYDNGIYAAFVGTFKIPTVDPNLFIITNASFALDAFVGGCGFGAGQDSVLEVIIDFIARVGPTNATQLGGPWWFEDVRHDGQFDYVYGHGALVNYTNVPVNVPYALTNFQTGSDLDDNGFVNIKFFVLSEVAGYIYEPRDVQRPSMLAVAGFVSLSVNYGLEPTGLESSTTNLPSVEPVDPVWYLSQAGDLVTMPVPSNLDIPNEILKEVSLEVKQTTIVGQDVHLTFNTIGGKTNYVQASSSADASGFTDLSGPIVAGGTNLVAATFIDFGGVTNGPSRYYRIRYVP